MATVRPVLDIARSQIGYKESPAGRNQTKYSAAYGANGVPWCVEFIDWVMAQAGVLLPIRTAGVYALRDA